MKRHLTEGERTRREVMIRFVRSFADGTLAETIDTLPETTAGNVAKRSDRIAPSDDSPLLSGHCADASFPAVVRHRILALMGFSYESEADKNRPLHDYLQEALASDAKPDFPLTVCGLACCRCLDNASPPIPHVPCQTVCPVGALRKTKDGVMTIHQKTCILCGKCFLHCPFATIMERSELLKVMQAIAAGRQVIALVAPSAEAQFPGTVEQLFTAIHRAGFADVMEVALGAELTTEHEAKEFQQRILAGDTIMSSSCCTPHVEIVRRHVPAFRDKVSQTPSPMIFAGRLAREKYPDALNVFIGPCIAKRYEASNAPEIDRVITFEELGVLLSGYRIDILAQPPWPIPRPAAATARNFARTCGVTEAMLQELETDPAFLQIGFRLDSRYLDGIDRKTPAQLRQFADGTATGNFLEVMSCAGGCVNGPCSLN